MTRLPVKPLVLASPEDAVGRRCFDLMRGPGGGFARRECRRDPEKGTGRSAAGGARGGFGSAAARADARRTVGWLEAGA